MIPFSNREMKRNENKKQKMRYKIRFYYTTHYIRRDYSLYTTLIVSLPLDNNLQLQLQCSNNTTISLLLFLAFDSIFFFISKMRRKKSQKWFFFYLQTKFFRLNDAIITWILGRSLFIFAEKTVNFFKKYLSWRHFFPLNSHFLPQKWAKLWRNCISSRKNLKFFETHSNL